MKQLSEATAVKNFAAEQVGVLSPCCGQFIHVGFLCVFVAWNLKFEAAGLAL